MALLEVRDLHVRYEPRRHAPVEAVRDVSLRRSNRGSSSA